VFGEKGALLGTVEACFPQVLSFAANDAHHVTWCGIQKLCIKRGEAQYNFFSWRCRSSASASLRPGRVYVPPYESGCIHSGEAQPRQGPPLSVP
jgi:hypothetical protein